MKNRLTLVALLLAITGCTQETQNQFKRGIQNWTGTQWNHFKTIINDTNASNYRTVSGSGILNSTFSHYGDFREGKVAERNNGVLISNVAGKVLAYALFTLQERGRLFIDPNVDVYEGQLIGIHSRDNDLVVNPTKAKQLTNIRAAGSDENIILTPPIRMSLEQALDFIEDDELVEVTPKSIRLRKKLLTESERKRAGRA